MSGFPGPKSYPEVLAEQLRAEREQARSDAEYIPPQRTPDADDFCDALFLRAVLTRAGDRKTADMLEQAAFRIRRLEELNLRLEESCSRLEKICLKSTVQPERGDEPCR